MKYRLHMRLLCVLLVTLLLVGIVTPVFACIRDNDGNVPMEDKLYDVRYWRQGWVPDTGDETITLKSGSSTIKRAACSHFSMSYALVKMGFLNPANGDTPMTHIEKARNHNAFRTDWGYYEFAYVDEMYEGVVYAGVDYNVSGLSPAEGLTYVKGKMSEGYYVIGIVKTKDTNGHCIFFDGVKTDGTMSIGDSWANYLTWEGYYGKSETNTEWKYLELLKYSEAPCNTQPSIYETRSADVETPTDPSTGGTTTPSIPNEDGELRDITEEEVVQYQNLVQEKQLYGMPQLSNLASGAILPEFADLDGLTQSELSSLAAIQVMKDADKITIDKVAGAISVFAGIVLVLYAVALIVAFIFDSVNYFIDIELVTLLTFGNIKVVRDKNDYEKTAGKKGYATIAKLLIVIIVVAVAGICLINGTVLRLLYKIAGVI